MPSKIGGFSLIEVMISFMLIGIGALGLVKLQVYIEQQADFAMHSVQALNLAEQKLEWFRTRGASRTASTFPVADYYHDIVAGEDSSHPDYMVKWDIPSITLSGSLKTVIIEVSWYDRYGKKQRVELNTMISQYSEFD